MKTINLEAKNVTKKVTTTVTTKETKPEQYLRIMKEFAKFIARFDTGVSCCPHENGDVVMCKGCKFNKDEFYCLQGKLADILNDINLIEE